MKKALIIGATGQDGAYLAQFLLSRHYKVYGAYRRTSSANFWRIKELGIFDHPNLELVEHDVTDPFNAIHLLGRLLPDEVYNLAAQSYVGVSFQQPVTTTQVNSLGTLYMLEAIRMVDPEIRYYQAGTSEMFGPISDAGFRQNEQTAFAPKSPYGISKLYAHWTTINYRDAYNLYAVNGILFNHESPLRGMEFVTRRITHAAAQIKLGIIDDLEIGNLNAVRDWGHAQEYVVGMWQMMQQDKPDDYVLATGRAGSVREFALAAFQCADIDLVFEGQGSEEVGVHKSSGRVMVRVNPKNYRPCDVNKLVGDASKAKSLFGWEAAITWEALCASMYEADVSRNRRAA